MYSTHNEGHSAFVERFIGALTSESSFIFDYLLYKQVEGVAMSSPLCPTLENVFLCHYEKE